MKLLLKILSLVASISTASAGSLYLYADGVSLFQDSAPVTSGVYAVRLGTFNEGVFAPLLGSTYNVDNSGYLDAGFGEMEFNLNQSDNSQLPASSQFYISIVMIGQTENFNSAAPMAVLTDSSWLAPAFTLISSNTFSLTSNTAAVVGNYNYNSGAPLINVSAIPEPATAAALLGVAAIGFCGMRRRRSAA